MRVFHLSWMAFFICFFAWFGIAPLMVVVRDELSLTKEQISNIIIASVCFTMFARLLIGHLCDRFGPRLTYSGLLLLGALPVIGIAFSHSYHSFLIMRFLIGAIGASFVITQYHTTVMFAPKVVGTANATTAGWGNMGGGATQIIMPLIFSGFIFLGFHESMAWRLAMVLAGLVIFAFGIAYYYLTTDTPEGNFKELRLGHWRPQDAKASRQSNHSAGFWRAAADYRVWVLFIIYGACFGIELTMNNIAALYFHDKFQLDLQTAGLVAGLFGMMNLFARSLGGIVSDRAAGRLGLDGRIKWLGMVLFGEGLVLCLFSRMDVLPLAIIALLLFSLCVQMAEGATYAVVPFINRNALGSVAGIVGAGGNFGAIMAGYLFRFDHLAWEDALLYLGLVVTAVSAGTYLIRRAPQTQHSLEPELETPATAKEAVYS
jgi:NNP family nitrate/nitrite transporter-like MFS transporter